MDSTRFDALARALASGVGRHGARRRLAAGKDVSFLFVQGFASGRLTPSGEDGSYALTLERGLGQTIYFSDRPERSVGAVPTPRFLDGLGFSPENPPNAALVTETAPGEVGIVVLELTSPSYDEATHTATYQAKLLADDEQLGITVQAAPNGAAELPSSFGAASLFIDDCADHDIDCWTGGAPTAYVGTVASAAGFCWNYSLCMPCEPYGHDQPDYCSTFFYWEGKCNAAFPDCQGNCRPDLALALEASC